MSSNIRITRICQECGNDFIARTTVTQYCSDKCAKRAYKKRKRNRAIELSYAELEAKKAAELARIKAKEYLSVKEVAILLGCTNATVYKMIKNNKLKAVNLSERKTIVKMADIQNLFN